ncbi:MAG: FAD-linked oxidase [Ignavibacteria bacterium GWA2_55_11]|nr:MAG: FAD-linked oxidase [Ignavibacteria bacterium GWA2_55_11]OGU64458.1 MAG: FAD-linked oxidase [Ignavibacteria bacterium RIFCSPHIGHO2_02_FULL_56_12]OGU71150.1 MAG: FAD-linked oxidase [Ignavibacteria bacterium RIFCSPLOWO2_12_FULL_56_21]OGU72012.1 MAG: FAD-linked oxidase [Ignavibacteria bacterium RIFCSPLOWO2_02_FULL_55_14]
MSSVATLHRTLQTLRSRLNGRVIGPDDAAYDTARALFYGWIDRRPAAIVKVSNATDVVHVVTTARDAGVPLAVRSGGHSVAGHSMCDGGIVLDLSDMRKLEIDSANRTAWAETGLTAVQYTVASAEKGLATGFGDSGSVGIGGITLGGGIGFLVRKYGLTIDDLLAADMVTADGSLLRTDAENHPDLFWAIRGGGGNFGIATRFKFRLHRVDNIVGGMLFLPATPATIRDFMALSESAPEELSTIANVMIAPPMPFIPPGSHGKPIIMGMFVCTGPIDAGERIVAPFRKLAPPIADMLKPMRYHEMYQEEGPHPAAASLRSMFIDSVDTGTAESILAHLQESKAMMSVAQLRMLGGAMARVPSEATAFAHRKRRIMVNLAALYERPQDSPVYESWVERFTKDIRRGDANVYVNFLGDEGKDRIRMAYPGTTYDRLADIKALYDPDNFFKLNHNILPHAN